MLCNKKKIYFRNQVAESTVDGWISWYDDNEISIYTSDESNDNVLMLMFKVHELNGKKVCSPLVVIWSNGIYMALDLGV